MPTFDSIEQQEGIDKPSARDAKRGLRYSNDPHSSVLSRLIHAAIETLQDLNESEFLLEGELPRSGFAPPVELPLGDSLPADAVKSGKDSETTALSGYEKPEAEGHQVLAAGGLPKTLKHKQVDPPTGAKSATGQHTPSGHSIELTLTEVATGAAGAHERALRWRRPIKGVAERTASSLDSPSDYGAEAISLRPVAIGPLSLDAAGLATLLNQPLDAVDLSRFVAPEGKDERGAGARGSVPETLPFDYLCVDEHPDAKTTLAQSALKRLRSDMKTYAERQRNAVRHVLDCSGVNWADLPGMPRARAAEALVAARTKLVGLLKALIDCRGRDTQFVNTAASVIRQATNDVFLPGGSLVRYGDENREGGWALLRQQVRVRRTLSPLSPSSARGGEWCRDTATVAVSQLRRQCSSGSPMSNSRQQRRGVMELATIFPGQHEHVLAAVLHSCEGNLEEAVELLMAVGDGAVDVADQLPPPAKILITGAGVLDCNGAYERDGEFMGAPLYVHERGRIWVLRYQLPNGSWWWYVADKERLHQDDGDFYRVPSDRKLPPTHEDWRVARDGVAPLPQFQPVYDAVEATGTDEGDGPGEAVAFRFLLLRHSGHEAALWMEYLIACLLSSRAGADVERVQPLLPSGPRDELLNLLAALLLRANRIAQTNRTLDALDLALKEVEGAIGRISLAHGKPAPSRRDEQPRAKPPLRVVSISWRFGWYLDEVKLLLSNGRTRQWQNAFQTVGGNQSEPQVLQPDEWIVQVTQASHTEYLGAGLTFQLNSGRVINAHGTKAGEASGKVTFAVNSPQSQQIVGLRFSSRMPSVLDGIVTAPAAGQEGAATGVSSSSSSSTNNNTAASSSAVQPRSSGVGLTRQERISFLRSRLRRAMIATRTTTWLRARTKQRPVTAAEATSIQQKLDALYVHLLATREYRALEAQRRMLTERIDDIKRDNSAEGAREREALRIELAELDGEKPAPSSVDAAHTGLPNLSELCQLQPRTSTSVDPRFLVFEFVWSLLLRQRQVDLVLANVRAASQPNGSLVKQMIMGAGKTTVVSPLISLMLAQCEYIVVQCVPQALLAMSSAVLRMTFSSIIRKRVYTFECNRGSVGDATLRTKLQSARANGSVIITTPTALKSLMLKFVEGLLTLTTPSDRNFKSRDLKPETEVWADILGLFRNGLCVMDEVDLVLHPLKSELNFPIGAKVDLDYTREGERWKLPIVMFDVILFAARKGEHALSEPSYRLQESELPTRLQLERTPSLSVQLMQALIDLIVRGFQENALQREPHMVLLREEFYRGTRDRNDGLFSQLLRWMLRFLRNNRIAQPLLSAGLHTKSRGGHPQYPPRAAVPDALVPWEKPFAEYEPTEFVDESVLGNSSSINSWADPPEITPEVRQAIEERGSYELGASGENWGFDANGRPMNPRGRTGMSNRGLCGKWGPNHAADPVVTRFNPHKKEPTLEVCVVRRADTGEWALPGGFVQPNEQVSETLRRVFAEEAGVLSRRHQREDFNALVNELISSEHAMDIYRGYVDDPRNTDNAYVPPPSIPRPPVPCPCLAPALPHALLATHPS
jgi:hypothetical protein